MKELLKKITEVYDTLVVKESNATFKLSQLDTREQDLRAREAKCTAYESADAVLMAAEIRRKEADAEFARLEEERVKFENLMREERTAIRSEEARLAPLQDREKQLAKDRETLYAREQALEVEKKEFKTRYIEKIKAHFKNTGGAPDPDAIT